MDLKKLWNKNEISIVNNIFSEIKNTTNIRDINFYFQVCLILKLILDLFEADEIKSVKKSNKM